MSFPPVIVRIPATAANLGPGYGCLGMALDLWNTVEVCPFSHGRSVVLVEGQGAEELPADSTNLVYRAMAALWREAGVDAPVVEVRCNNEIPLNRGLGSCSAAVVGGLVAANQMAGCPFSQDKLLQMAAQLDGRPNNVAPALLGGLQVTTTHEGRVVASPVPIPMGLTAVLFMPEVARQLQAVVPDQVSMEDAVFNLSRVALLVNAMASSRVDDLSWCTEDRLLQSLLQKQYPAAKLIFAGAMAGGALGVFLSGKGPTVLALTRGNEMTVGYEMIEAGRQARVSGAIKVTRPSRLGAYLA